ncbi:MAG TPA: hypothetical protein VGJ32_04600 [Solirubrobacteraceae bacterium]
MGRDERRARQARRLGALGLAVAIGLPAALWWQVVADIWAAFRFEPRYFLGWTPWLLMAAGIGFFIPVAWSAGADPEGRFYPRARNAYLGWGISLYLLGFLLAWQVARLHDGSLTA